MNWNAQDTDVDKSIALQIADLYILNTRKWKKFSYKLRYRGKEGHMHIVSGYLLKDRESAFKFYKENPHINQFGYYPSEFVLTINIAEKKVVEDFRHGQKERNPRP
jgi:hypothetical protein